MVDESFDWHGWGLSDGSAAALHIGRLPGRKSLCLYVQYQGVIDTLAFFRNEESAKRALAALDRLLEHA